MSLSRFWFEFDLDGHRPPSPAPGTVNLDGGTVQYRKLSWGAGVTARDEEDALALLRRLVDADLPSLTRTVKDVYVDATALGLPDFLVLGDSSRRGVWFPPDNLSGRPA